MSIAPIVRTLHVAVTPARAFEIFTGHMGRWWHPEHHIAANAFVDLVIEPQVGGRWFERDAEGKETPWGKVLEWSPPGRVLLGWQLTSDFAYDPDFLTEVEVIFEPAEGGTQVTLTHHNMQRFGEGAAALAEGMNEGWGMLLEGYRAEVGRAG